MATETLAVKAFPISILIIQYRIAKQAIPDITAIPKNERNDFIFMIYGVFGLVESVP